MEMRCNRTGLGIYIHQQAPAATAGGLRKQDATGCGRYKTVRSLRTIVVEFRACQANWKMSLPVVWCGVACWLPSAAS